MTLQVAEALFGLQGLQPVVLLDALNGLAGGCCLDFQLRLHCLHCKQEFSPKTAIVCRLCALFRFPGLIM